MDQALLPAIAAVLVLLIALAVFLTFRKRRTDHLRDRFGDEYDRTVEVAGGKSKAEVALAEREKRVEALTIRPLTAAEFESYSGEWRDVKALFVDSPAEAVLRADRTLAGMMKTVGYPMADFDRRYEDLTVNHADFALHYREAHTLVHRTNDAGVSTEDRRQAMQHFEALFDHLTHDAERAGSPVQVASAAPAPVVGESAAPVEAGTITHIERV